jgi:hypothetical protein
MVYLGMDAPGTSSSHARCKRASDSILDSDDEIEEDDGDDGDGVDDYEAEDDK